jgi:uncharacterized protein (DUF362 family)
VLFFVEIFIFFARKRTNPMAGKPGMTRREILTGAAGAAAAASLSGIASCFPSVGGTWPDAGPDAADKACGCALADGGTTPTDDNQSSPVSGASTVVTIQRDDSIDAKGKSLAQPQIDAIQSMVDAVLSSLAGGAANPWSVLLPNAGPCTRIGLKVNCLNPYLPTSPSVVRAIIKNLQTNLQACPSNIIVWDRSLEELKNTGKYTDADLQGASLIGTLSTANDASSPGYTDANYGTIEGFTPRLSRILTEQTDITINCPVLKSHGVSGVTAGMKNIFGIIDIPSSYHSNLPTALPALFRIPQIRNSIKLTIVDALQAVTLADTSSRPDKIVGRIFASLDPLALDHYALDVVNKIRLDTFSRDPVDNSLLGWLDNAYQLGLGTKDYNLVEL